MREKYLGYVSAESVIGTGESSRVNSSAGRKRTENVAWESNEPTKLVLDAVEQGIIKKGDTVVDIGCGFGRNANYLASQGVRVVAVNINKEELVYAQQRAEEMGVEVSYVEADAQALPLPDQSCDVALDLGCSHMLDREGQLIAEQEAARVVRPGGYLIYFGFTRAHPVAQSEPDNPQFRDLEEIKEMYGGDFDIVTHQEVRWRPKLEERANFSEHVGMSVMMRRRGSEPVLPTSG